MAPSSTRDCPVPLLSTRDCPVSLLSTTDCPVPLLSTRDCPVSLLSTRDCPVPLLSTRDCPVPLLSTRDCPVSLLSTRDRHKLRKPVVEKMRRDRINSCIEQLKVLPETEFHTQDANAKLEKADVLEMTVVFLKQRLQPRLLMLLEGDDALPVRQLSEATSHVQAAAKPLAAPDGVVWRPW
ncbi:uncharacterized protein AB9X84_010418 [Acanthopagrus schlegelii]